MFEASYILLQIFLMINITQVSAEKNYLLPLTFGNYSTVDLDASSSCGTTMTTYNSIPAKSNGADQGTGSSCGGYSTWGSQYQCVEYVQRYMNLIHGIAPIWYDNANQMCASHPSGITKTTSPKAGDAVVFNWGSYGHTAIITSISGGYVHVVEQNASPTGTNSYSTSEVYCYLTTTSSSGSCSHLGYYCGNDGLGKDANTLYYCSGSGASPVVSKSCAFTCVTMPSGQDDTCSTSGTCSTVKTGYYCGTDKVEGDKNTLYYCINSAPEGATYCGNGCYTASSGSDDYCK